MMFEVCRSRALDKTNLSVTGFVAWSCMLLVWHKKAITNKKNGNTYEKNPNKDDMIIINTRTRNKILVRSIIFLLSEKTRTQNKRWAGFNTNFDFDDCCHRETKHAYK